MATTVFDIVTVKLQDGKDVNLKPLNIGLLRKFMEAWKQFANVEDEDQMFDIYVNCCGIALSKELAGTFENPLEKDGSLADDYRAYLEDILDIDTIFKILDVCGGLKLNDPKLLEQIQNQQVQDGTN